MRTTLTDEALTLMRSLGVSGRLENLPLDMAQLAVLIAKLQERVESLERKRK